VASIVGQRDGCNPKKTANNPKRCERMSGLAKTGLHIMNQLNTTGMTLILQDKHALHTAQLMKLVASVPSDWDVIRFNCEGKVPDTYEYTSNNVSSELSLCQNELCCVRLSVCLSVSLQLFLYLSCTSKHD
jgi:hypothetical protein